MPNHPLCTRDTRAESIANTIGTIDHPHRHDTDGQVYVGYFRNDVTRGFIWDSNIEHPVQVTREMGEPVIATFLLPDLGVGLSPTTLFHLFKQACDRYADIVSTTEEN